MGETLTICTITVGQDATRETSERQFQRLQPLAVNGRSR